MTINEAILKKLSDAAWEVREHAHLQGTTKVGAALISQNSKIYTGCNIEHRFRSHDIHAEVNAISNMVAAGEKQFDVIIIAAERERFTPCGSCMDWIMQHGGPDCTVAYQSKKDGKITEFLAKDLMPFYPF